MQVNFSKVLCDVEKKAIKDGETEFTLRRACVNALVSETQESQKDSGEDKVKRWKLANRIADAVEEIEVTAEEIALIKKKLNDVYATLIVGQAYGMLEGQV